VSYFGIYLGKVELVADPAHLGRIKVRVPSVYGVIGGASGAVPVDDLPWAIPMGLPAGGSEGSGGLSMLPKVGDQVAIQFLDGEPEKPVWQWLMQTQDQAKAFKLHQYAEASQNGQDVTGDPLRAILTRYGHSLEVKEDKVTLTTKEGYQILLETSQSSSGGSLSLQTPKGQRLNLNDARENAVLQALGAAVVSAKKVILNTATSILAKTTRFTILAGSSMITFQGDKVSINTGSGASLLIDPSGNIALVSAGGTSVSLEGTKVQIAEPLGAGIILEGGKVSVNAPQCVINTAAMSVGTAVGSPVALMTAQMIAYLLTHTHTNGNEGSPTGPPIPLDPLFPTDSTSTRLQTS
jgi:hypothetical protein